MEQTSSPTDQTEMNGVAEQTNLDLGETVRVVLRTSGLPKSFWGLAYDAVVAVRRLLPRKTARGWTSPFQFATGFEPDVSHLRVWGSKAFRNLPRGQVVGKLDDRAHIGYLVGYSTLPVGYAIWDTAKQKIFVTTDVIFDEDIPTRAARYHAEIDAAFKVVSSRIELKDIMWLKGTTHVDDENGVLYRTKVVEVRVFQHQPYVVGRRAVELADGSSGPLEKDWIYVGDLVRMTEATPGFVPPKGHPDFDGIPLELHPKGLISQTGGSKQQTPQPAGSGLEAEGVLPDIISPVPPDDISVDRSHQQRSHRRRKSPANHEANRSRKKPSVVSDANQVVDPSGRVLRPRVTSIIGQSLPRCRNMTILLICSSLFTENERICAATVNLGGGVRPLPRNRRDSESGPYAAEWKVALDDELENVRSRDVLHPLEQIPTHVKRVLGTTFVFKWKYPNVETTNEGSASESSSQPKPKAKVRVCVQDFNFFAKRVENIFAPTGKGLTFRLFMNIALMFDLFVHHIDVKAAFLYAMLDEEVWIWPFPGEPSPPGFAHRLKRSLYGLRNAPRNWYLHLAKVLTDQLGFVCSFMDVCLFYRWCSGRLILILIYVDDILIAGGDEAEIEEIKRVFRDNFTITDLGPVQRYLGVRLTYVRGEYFELDQEIYCVDLLTRFSDSWTRVFGGPTPKQNPLPSDAHDHTGPTTEPPSKGTDEYAFMESFPYLNIVGALLYLSLNSRPDIAFAVCFLGRFAKNPNYGACWCACWLLSYLSGTFDYRVRYTKSGSPDIFGFVDSDWAADMYKRRSTCGYLIKIFGGPLAWGSKLMTTIATSSMQAEYQGYYYVMCQLLFIYHICDEIGFPFLHRVPLFTDAEAALKAAHNPAMHQLTKHFAVKFHWIRHYVDSNSGMVHLIWTSNVNNEADLMTKVMTGPMREAHIHHIMGWTCRPSKDLS